jgi:hypothetical protein
MREISLWFLHIYYVFFKIEWTKPTEFVMKRGKNLQDVKLMYA